jgi:predicted signal transduction protein with EAL and GGDEF domain
MPNMTEANAPEHAQGAVDVMGEPVDVEGVPFALDAVAGVALSPEHGRDRGTLLTKAELAASEARRLGRPTMVYAREAATETQRRIDMLRELRVTLGDPARHQEVAVLYQPQVDVTTGRLTGVEALLRWTHPEWGPVRTDEVIEAIEPTEVMHLLTRHMLNRVAEQLRRWNDLGQPLRAAVNVSVQDLHEPGFVDELGTIIRDHGIGPEQLTVSGSPSTTSAPATPRYNSSACCH